MKNKITITYIRISIVFSLMLMSAVAFSQLSHGLLFADNVPQKIHLNPAATLNEDGYFIGVPVLNNVNTEFISGFKYDDYIVYRDDSLYFDPGRLLKTLDDQNLFIQNSSVSLVYLGIKRKKNTFAFGIDFKTSAFGSLSKNFIALLVSGNAQFSGKTTDFSKNTIQTSLYQEYYFNYSREIGTKFSAGITLKFLTGDVNLQVEHADFVLSIDSATYAHTGSADIKMNASVGTDLKGGFVNTINPYGWFQFSQNLGYAFDLGITYKPLKNLVFSASLLDVGKIFWNNHPENYQINVDSAYFEGVTLNLNSVADNPEDLSVQIMDDLSDDFNMQKTNESYGTPTISKLLFTCSYSFLRNNKVGLLYYGEVYNGQTASSVSVNYNRRFGDVLVLGINYNTFNFKAHNLGLTAIINAEPLQFYFSTNNIFGLFKPEHTNVYQLNFGVNFIF